MIATLKVTDAKGKLIHTKQFEPASITRAAEKFQLMYPDYFILVTQGADFIALPAHKMKADESLVDNGLMTFEKFMSKWYPSKKKIKAKDIEKELASEFSSDASDSYDPWVADQPNKENDAE
jgi:hypothetical protein